jgi:selenocysteine lyase/cysteine desulfurase
MTPKGYEEKFFADARKFDSGGKMNPLLLPMLRTAMEEVALVNPDEAQSQLKSLIAPLLEWASKNNYITSPGPHASHLIGIRPESLATTQELLEMCNELQKKGIYVVVRCGLFRISPYLSNTETDIQRLIQGLEEVNRQL